MIENVARSSAGRMIFSKVNFVCLILFRYPFHARVTALARKRSRSFCLGCRQQVTVEQACILHQQIRSGMSVRTHQGNELTRNSPGNSRPQSSQLTEPLWTDPCSKGVELPRAQELATLLQNTQAGNFVFLIALRSVERGSARRSSLKGRERDIVSQTNIGTVSKATSGKLLRDGVERIWAFTST